MPTTFEIFFGPENRVVTLKLIRYTLWMVLIPLATFYFCFYIIFRGNKAMLGWSGIAAVIAVNAVIASYVIMAWNEKDDLSDNNSNNNASRRKPDYRTD